MNKSKVVLIRCDTYDEDKVWRAVEEGVSILGGISCFVEQNEKIVIKPNLLFGTDPKRCVTTHPSVFKAVARLLKKARVDVYYGDSPGFGRCERHAEKAKIKQVADELSIKLADFDQGRPVSHKKALLNKKFVIANGVFETDGLISVSKLKTHMLTRLTGATKNQFGCIPGLLKSEYHLKMPDPYDFSTMLVDLNTLIRPRLYIMDAIMAMEGNGPRNGRPKELNVLLFSSDPVALDSVACKIIDLNPEYLPTSRPGEEAGLGTYHYENIEIIGDAIESFVDKNFDVTRSPPVSSKGGHIKGFIKNRISFRPVIDDEKCTKCGTCVMICPAYPKAINWLGGDKTRPPEYKYDRCIRCYCCQEVCPEGAISVKDTLLGRLFLGH